MLLGRVINVVFSKAFYQGISQSQSLLSVNSLICEAQMNFTRFSKPEKKPKIRDRKKSLALSDEKMAKLSQAESEEENQQKKQKELEQKKQFLSTDHIKYQGERYEVRIPPQQIEKLREEYLSNTLSRQRALKQPNFREKLQEHKAEKIAEQKLQKQAPLFPHPNEMVKFDVPQLTNQVVQQYFNSEDIINADKMKLIKPIEDPSINSKRTGVLAVKVGMTSLWDKWGVLRPLTVLQLDRCQVVQVKTIEKDGYSALQLGLGQKNLKRLQQPQIGHLMKHDIGPQRVLEEFRISPENVLPTGYMMTARHFTPGQFVDVCGTSKGLGWTGTIKGWNFDRQPASHGNSLSHRIAGTTGQRQDPGRVFKGLKMSGRMGNERVTTHNLKVYKIDVDRGLIYILGGVPGRAGGVVRVRDAAKKKWENDQFLNYPTFVPEPGQKYAREIVMNAPRNDPNEEYHHDNFVVEDESNKG